MDIEMKVMDGLTALSRIKARYPEARVLIVSQYDDPDLRAKAQMAGARAYFLKDNLAKLRQFICENSGPDNSTLPSPDPTPLRERNSQ
jgi:DNA-binding NarL/FixJ family response regulator